MKAILTVLSVVAVLGLTAPTFAGPNTGSPSFGQQAIKHMREMRERREHAKMYALTGDRAEAKEYRWETKLIWVGGNRDRRVVYDRVPVE
ncbi:MAG: hypothetical protein GC162_13975 [Planctomycetes bacterium]|nr:hypothetical protein [Planctomycetota bacterium]